MYALALDSAIQGDEMRSIAIAAVLLTNIATVFGQEVGAPELTDAQVEKLRIATLMHGISDTCFRRYGYSELYEMAKHHLRATAAETGDAQLVDFIEKAIPHIENDTNRELPPEWAVDRETCAKVREKLSAAD
jgi:hypothetical protein